MHYHHQFGVLVPFVKKHSRLIILAIAGIFILSQFTWLMNLARAGGDDSKVVVQPSTLSLDPGKNWYFYDDVANSPNTTEAPGDYEFVDGPGDPPEGDGSVRFEVTGNERWNIATYFYAGTDLDDIDKLKFNTYQPSANPGSPNERAVYLHFDVDFDKTTNTGYQGRLVYVPRDNGDVEQDEWQEWDSLDDGEGLWRWSGFVANGNKWLDNNTNELREWDDIVDDFPKAEIFNESFTGQLLFRAGEPYADGFVGFLDKVTIEASPKVVYDFEPDLEGDCLTTPFFHEDNELQIQSNENNRGNQTTTTCIVVVDCEVVGISADRDLSNVIVKYQDGTYDKYDEEDFGDETKEWDVPQQPGNLIVGLWIHAGNNHYPPDPDPEEYNNGNSVGRYHEIEPPEGCEVLGEDCKPGPGWASGVLGNLQGPKKDDTAITGPRTDTSHAIGAPDAVITPVNDGFYSLGEDGWITVKFDDVAINGPGDDLTFHEVTSGRSSYHTEVIAVEASNDNGATWHPLGTVTNKDNMPSGIGSLDLGALMWADQIRMTDTTDFDPPAVPQDADGYDLDAVGANFTCEQPEPCEEGETLVLVQTENGYQFVCQEPEEPIEPCFVTVVSDITNTVNELGDTSAVDLASPHPAWVNEATLPPATWIWGNDPVSDHSVDEFQTFKKQFFWSGPVIDAELQLASDNSHTIYVNGVEVFASTTGSGDNHHGALTTHDLTAHINEDSVNTIEIKVKNIGVHGSNQQSNPAGLLYKLVVEGEKGCDQPPPPIVECAILVSDFTNKISGTDDPAVHVGAPHHDAWTAEVPGATWIWTEHPLSDAAGETSGSFEKTFTWNGPVTDALLDIATDNTYEVWVNGVKVHEDLGEDNYSSSGQDNIDLSGVIAQGENTIKFVVTNLAQDGGTQATNPAGLLYKLVVEGEEGCGEPPEITECEVVVSDMTNTIGDTESLAVPVAFIHDAWDAVIPGALWIWTEDPLSDPAGDTFGTFSKSFNWNGPVSSAVLEISADNSYKVWLNGNPVPIAEDATENNFGSHDTYNVVGIQNGVNTLVFEVKNWAQENGTTESNPAGLLYRLVVEGEEGCEDEPEEEELLGSIQGTVYRDDNQNLIKDLAELPLVGVDVWLFTHNSPWTFVNETTTDGNGEYLFEHLTVPGTYYVCQDLQDGWIQTQLNNAGLGGVDIGSLNPGDQFAPDGHDAALDAFMETFCYEVELSESALVAINRDFGSLPNVLGEEDPGDDDDGETLGETDDGEVLAETGNPAILALVVGFMLIGSAVLVRSTKKQ